MEAQKSKQLLQMAFLSAACKHLGLPETVFLQSMQVVPFAEMQRVSEQAALRAALD